MDLLFALLLHTTSVDTGNLTYYAPGDGHNRGVLACGGRFSSDQIHIARRDWKQLGCDRKVLICAEDTLTCAWTHVRDAGPFGVSNGKKWRLHVGQRPPKGWRFRAITDLSVGLWHRLGRPRHLSRAYIVVMPRTATKLWKQLKHFLHRQDLLVAL